MNRLGGIWSSAYMFQAQLNCLRLFTHRMPWALFLAATRFGRSKPAKIAMIAMTTSNSINVKALSPHPGKKRGRRRRMVFSKMFQSLLTKPFSAKARSITGALAEARSPFGASAR